MENASKALLIAGEVLIALIVLSILTYVFDRVYALAEGYQSNVELQKIVAFNTEYTKYATKTDSYIYAEDVVTLAEKVINWNNIAGSDSDKIGLEILDNPIYSEDSFNRKTFLSKYKLEEENKFSCQVSLSDKSGRVNQIIIQIVD